MKFIFIIPIVFVFLFCVESVRACSCVRQEVCQFYSNARVVFSGEVLETFEKTKNVKHREMRIGSGKWEENTYVEKRQVSRIRIEESFTGTGDKKELFIETEIGSSCALPLQKGVRYLIYASHVENEENLMTYFCSGTKPVSSAQEDLSYLRANKKNSGATVSGKVGFGDWGKLNPAQLSKNGIKTINLESGNTKLSADIAQDGSYSFPNVSAGKYKIKLILPNMLININEYNPAVAKELGIGDQSIIDVSGHGCFVKDFLIARKRKPRKT